MEKSSKNRVRFPGIRADFSARIPGNLTLFLEDFYTFCFKSFTSPHLRSDCRGFASPVDYITAFGALRPAPKS